jgi:putative addiction module killer protein
MYPFGYNLPMYTVRLAQDFQDWLDELADRRAQVRIAARLRLAEAGSLGDWRPVAGSVSEMRVDFGPGYRLYFTRREHIVVVLLCGGDKSSQKRDISRAQRIARELESES